MLLKSLTNTFEKKKLPSSAAQRLHTRWHFSLLAAAAKHCTHFHRGRKMIQLESENKYHPRSARRRKFQRKQKNTFSKASLFTPRQHATTFKVRGRVGLTREIEGKNKHDLIVPVSNRN